MLDAVLTTVVLASLDIVLSAVGIKSNIENQTLKLLSTLRNDINIHDHCTLKDIIFAKQGSLVPSIDDNNENKDNSNENDDAKTEE